MGKEDDAYNHEMFRRARAQGFTDAEILLTGDVIMKIAEGLRMYGLASVEASSMISFVIGLKIGSEDPEVAKRMRKIIGCLAPSLYHDETGDTLAGRISDLMHQARKSGEVAVDGGRL